MSEEQERRLPTWQELYDWACSKPEDESVGQANRIHDCPIARYQRELYKEGWVVRSHEAHPWGMGDTHSYTPEAWYHNWDYLTAKQFKAILERVKEKYNL